MAHTDTIAAVATARGAAGIAVVRVSGPAAFAIFRRCFRAASGRDIAPRALTYGFVTDKDASDIDEALGVMMPAPKTYTREDVCEIQCHGGDLAASRVLNRLMALGCRAAEPGEFTRRAFLNGRIDLSRAEAVMQVIQARSERAARVGMRQLEGGVSGFVRGAMDRLRAMEAAVAAAIDFPEEVDEVAGAAELRRDILALQRELTDRCDERAARLLTEGASVALIGRPNVGKSSLLNALVGAERAIVTEIPGTTRDVLTERCTFGGISATLSDTAGLRATDDRVESIGVARAKRQAEQADAVVLVIDRSAPLTDEDVQLLKSSDGRALVCLNKADLPDACSVEVARYWKGETVSASAVAPGGVDALRDAIAERLKVDADDDQLTVARQRGRALDAAECLGRAAEALASGAPMDLAADDLRRARRNLAAITGEDADEALLDEVFSKFCVGK